MSRLGRAQPFPPLVQKFRIVLPQIEELDNYDRWITDRTYIDVTEPLNGGTGEFNIWITNRIYYQTLVGVLVPDAAGQPTYKRSQGIPTAAGYRDRPGKWN